MLTRVHSSLPALLIALIAMIVAVAALLSANKSRQIALSTIEIEEGESLTLPVYDEAREQFGFIILTELEITNSGGPQLRIESLRKMEQDAGWLVALRGENIISANLQPRFFLLDRPLSDYQSNPRWLKDQWNQDVSPIELRWPLKPGAGKKIRYGIFLSPYNPEGGQQAEMVLVSLRLDFDNGKSHLFRRAYTIPALTSSTAP